MLTQYGNVLIGTSSRHNDRRESSLPSLSDAKIDQVAAAAAPAESK